MFYMSSTQGGTTHPTLAEAIASAEWQGQFCPAYVRGEDEIVLAEFWPDEDDLVGPDEDDDEDEIILTWPDEDDLVFAAFIVAPLAAGSFAATTRAADRGEAGRIGLPGGKLDAGETARAAAIREAGEEGWHIRAVADVPFYSTTVEGRTVVWYAAQSAYQRIGHKEAGRVEPVAADLAAIAASGYGNDAAMAAYADLVRSDAGGCGFCSGHANCPVCS